MSKKDFQELFNQWAPVYDKTVYDQEGEYNEVFEGYVQILNQVVSHVPEKAEKVLEIGVGTGNLTQRLLYKGLNVIGIEPSAEMRKQVKQKGLSLDLREGSFLELPLQDDEKVDVIVSSFAFHHLTLEEKNQSLAKMKEVLNEDGKLIFADTAYQSEETKQELLQRVSQQEKLNLLEDLKTEYYELIEDLQHLFQNQGFTFSAQQLNRFVWLIVGKS